MTKRDLHIIFSLLIFVPLFCGAVLLTPDTTKAISLTSPFGGKVQTWTPEAPGCAEITTAVAAATVGSVTITIEELKVGPPSGGTFGLLRVNGVLVMPPPTNMYKYRSYQMPGNWVLGSSFDLCQGGGNLGGISEGIASKICDAAGEGTQCPINNLVYRMGTSLAPFGF